MCGRHDSTILDPMSRYFQMYVKVVKVFENLWNEQV